ncbi:hypothetical protein NECAME_13411 [Necator americanus]|uniref:Uncharacterized protein n=1 Tax=Necator americanus TaxID=51031 RepID=W2SY57_NECAM|nr:hypothetical protein NECAME_13411 [Necator americanus]ETN73791.1 hypothetical protein NECAME_13411 [Necator americanus]
MVNIHANANFLTENLTVMSLDSQDKVFLGATLATAVVGAALVVTGFVLRFGRGFGTFVTYARKVYCKQHKTDDLPGKA